jgi:N-acetylmuramoyl-L-alanine amidase
MIFISAGHHPAAPGATFERFIEHDEAVIWAQQLVDEIGENATLVPTGTLQNKVDFINSRLLNGDIAIEIHFNAAIANGQHVGRGSETLYYPGSEKGEKLAAIVQHCLATHYPPDRGVKEGWYRMDPKRGPDFFLARTKCPAIIIEPDFVHRFELIQEHRDDAINHLANILSE